MQAAIPSPPPPSPLTCSALDGQTVIDKASCGKADASGCSFYYAWKDLAAGKARLCYGPEPGQDKCSGTVVKGCIFPPPALPPTALTCSDLHARTVIDNKSCRKADASLLHPHSSSSAFRRRSVCHTLLR
mmetsp:Transcript_40564/g.134252  ORF Transcript_40564/g.134252 Transcript_40564/m.134252 type:complete len:130 (-) Transcript_40564:1179-1568(-)